MPRSICFALLILGLLNAAAAVATAADGKPDQLPVAATIATSLTTAGDQIRQFAFDGDAGTCFVSARGPSAGDHFTLNFDQPVAIDSITVTTGRAEGGDELGGDQFGGGALEVSSDGKAFERLAVFTKGVAQVRPDGRLVQAVRVSATADLFNPLVIRELSIKSQPPVAVFEYPVEFVVDASDAPEMKEWAEKVAHTCERAYRMINEELKSKGYKPPHMVTMALKNDYQGVAATGGDHIVGSVKFFKQHPDDVGAMVHETVHVVQNYRGRRNPGWLVEGVADYVRFFKFEPGNLGPIDAERAHYDGSYRVSAAFLAYLVEKYDQDIVRKLNKLLRAGEYRDKTFEELTGKTLGVLDDEWRATLGL